MSVQVSVSCESEGKGRITSSSVADCAESTSLVATGEIHCTSGCTQNAMPGAVVLRGTAKRVLQCMVAIGWSSCAHAIQLSPQPREVV